MNFLKSLRKEKRKSRIHRVLEKRKRVDGKGRVYLPESWRRKLGLRKGDEITLRLMGTWIEVHPATERGKR